MSIFSNNFAKKMLSSAGKVAFQNSRILQMGNEILANQPKKIPVDQRFFDRYVGSRLRFILNLL